MPKEPKTRSMPSFVACAIKSSWSSRPTLPACVNAQSRRHPRVERPAWQVQKMSSANIKDVVREKYGELASRVQSGAKGNCCSSSAADASCDPITSNIYSAAQEDEVPDTALKASLGCGNPTAIAELK